ncbi:MAG: DUF262 domain-containing HNH endonuclease family protein [Pseudomonadota bacterium]
MQQDTDVPPPPINVEIRTIEQHFSSEHTFRMPWFQRAYAWSEEHAMRLLRDIIDASQGNRGRYALGGVMLAAPEGQKWAALIDGHQRTLTLTILIALLRDLIETPATKARLDALIHCNRTAGSEGDPVRVTPQPCNVECFKTYVQQMGATLREREEAMHGLLESERNLLQNRDRLAELIVEHLPTEQAKLKLTAFLLERCYLIVQIVVDEEEAWEMLSVEETTGLAFHASERSKVAIITVMHRSVQEEAGRTWDLWQARLGADGMTSLLRHIRALKAHKTSAKPIEQDLVELYNLEDSDLSFISDILVPYAQYYLAIQNADLGCYASKAEIGYYINMLSWLPRQDWIPPVLSWIKINGADHSDTITFFRRLDRLAWLMRIAGRDPIEQERRFRSITNLIVSGGAISDVPHLQIDERIAHLSRKNLLSRTFYDKSYSRLVLRRLSILAGQDCGPINGDQATVEHVLPRNPPQGSPWLTMYPDKKAIDQHAHRLGNLVVLTFAENQRAGVRPLQEKQRVFATTFHVLARQVSDIAEWTPDFINRRSEELASQLFDSWELDISRH